MIRWLVDKYIRVKFRDKNLTEEEFVAETDKSPGVLMASGYIAGGRAGGSFHRLLCRTLEREDRRDRAVVARSTLSITAPGLTCSR